MAAADVRELILASGQEALVQREVPSERLYGGDGAPYQDIGRVAIELTETPPEDLRTNVDALASILPDADVQAGDRLEIEGTTYRVQTVEHRWLFGVETHRVLELVARHDGS